MKKKILIVLLVVSMIALVGCQGDPAVNDQENVEQSSVNTDDVSPTSRLDGLKEAFAEAGFKVGDNEIVAFEMLYADSGMKFTLDGELIEIYEYDMSSLSDEAKAVVDQAKGGSVDFSGFNIPVKFKEGIMLVRYDEHSQGEKIVDVFNQF